MSLSGNRCSFALLVTKVYSHVISLVWELRLYISRVCSGHFASLNTNLFPYFSLKARHYYVGFWRKQITEQQISVLP